MSQRLSSILMTLWFFFAIASLFIALALSPMGIRLLLPGSQATSWVYPALLVLPPLLLLVQRSLGSRVSRPLALILAASLALIGLLLFVFLASMFVGSPL